MRPDESLIGQPVRSLQTMLRVLSEHDERYQRLIPDGIYGPQTIRAVSTFQNLHGLPVTGITDQRTWEAIVALYEPARIAVAQAQPLDLLLNTNEILYPGSQNPNLLIVQAVLWVLSDAYGSIGRPSLNGILDAATADALASFQILANLPMTGALDKVTWKHLACHFPLAANLLVKNGRIPTGR